MGRLPPELERERVTAELFADEKRLGVWRNNRQGISHVDERSGVLLRGAIDALLVKDGKFVILDFKTRGFALKDETPHYYQDQLNLYNYLFRKNGYPTADYAYLLFYIPQKINGHGDLIFDTKLVKMPINVEHAERLFHKAVRVLKGPLPEPAKTCEFCAWRKSSA